MTDYLFGFFTATACLLPGWVYVFINQHVTYKRMREQMNRNHEMENARFEVLQRFIKDAAKSWEHN